MLFEINHKSSGSVLFSLKCDTLKECLEKAVDQDANLRVPTSIPSNGIFSVAYLFGQMRQTRFLKQLIPARLTAQATMGNVLAS